MEEKKVKKENFLKKAFREMKANAKDKYLALQFYVFFLIVVLLEIMRFELRKMFHRHLQLLKDLFLLLADLQ